MTYHEVYLKKRASFPKLNRTYRDVYLVKRAALSQFHRAQIAQGLPGMDVSPNGLISKSYGSMTSDTSNESWNIGTNTDHNSFVGIPRVYGAQVAYSGGPAEQAAQKAKQNYDKRSNILAGGGTQQYKDWLRDIGDIKYNEGLARSAAQNGMSNYTKKRSAIEAKYNKQLDALNNQLHGDATSTPLNKQQQSIQAKIQQLKNRKQTAIDNLNRSYAPKWSQLEYAKDSLPAGHGQTLISFTAADPRRGGKGRAVMSNDNNGQTTRLNFDSGLTAKRVRIDPDVSAAQTAPATNSTTATPGTTNTAGTSAQPPAATTTTADTSATSAKKSVPKYKTIYQFNPENTGLTYDSMMTDQNGKPFITNVNRGNVSAQNIVSQNNTVNAWNNKKTDLETEFKTKFKELQKQRDDFRQMDPRLIIPRYETESVRRQTAKYLSDLATLDAQQAKIKEHIKDNYRKAYYNYLIQKDNQQHLYDDWNKGTEDLQNAITQNAGLGLNTPVTPQ